MAKQLVSPNVEISEAAGMCLQYARRVFSAPVVEATAWEGWTRSKYRHENREFPSGLAVPVWFDWWGQLPGDEQKFQYGHAAVRLSDGSVWSSPLSGKGRARFGSVDELTRAFGGGMKYVGWSEDISEVKVVEIGGEEMESTSYEVARLYAQKILFRDMDRGEWEKFHQGKSRNQLFDEFSTSAEWEGKWRIINIEYPQVLGRLQASEKPASNYDATELKPGVYRVK